MRVPVLAPVMVVACLGLGLPASAQAQETCTAWEGDAIYDIELSTAGDTTLLVARVTGGTDRLVAVPIDVPGSARTLSARASSFRLASWPGGHLLVVQQGLQDAVVAQRLAPDGRELGAPILIFPAGGGDRRLHEVFFDGAAFAVIIDTGDVLEDEPWLLRVSTDGAPLGEPVAVDVAHDSSFLPGPAPGALWVIETRQESLPWHVVARVWSEGDGVGAPVADLGAGRLRGATVSPTGDLLVLHDPDDGPAGTFASLVTLAGPTGAPVPLGADGSWTVAARTTGGYVAIRAEDGLIIGLLLDENGAPLAAPMAWAEGEKPRLTGRHLAWSRRIEAGDLTHSSAMIAAFDPTALPGAPTTLLGFEQRKVEYSCGIGCSVSPAPGPPAAGAWPLLLLVAAAALATRRRRA